MVAARWTCSRIFPLFILLVMMSGCASVPIAVSPGVGRQGEKVVLMKLSGSGFEPNIIQVQQGDVLVIGIQNTSVFPHNITIENPRGEIIKDLDIPRKGMIRTRLRLSEPGEYEFHCGKLWHHGTKGRIEVTRAQAQAVP